MYTYLRVCGCGLYTCLHSSCMHVYTEQYMCIIHMHKIIYTRISVFKACSCILCTIISVPVGVVWLEKNNL